MKKGISYPLLLTLLLLFQGVASAQPNVPGGTRVPLADPYILLHDGIYYAYGTGAANGIEVWVSEDLETWSRGNGCAAEGLALHKDDVWGDRWFWAPEVYALNGKFYMYYSAEEHICAAVAESPLGPFIQEKQRPMIEDEKSIDNTLFIDQDNRAYMFFDRFNDGLNIWMAEMQDDLSLFHKAEFLPLVGHILDRSRARAQSDEDGLHLVALTVGHQPGDGVPLGVLFEEVLRGEHHLPLVLVREKLRRSRPQRGKHVKKGLYGRGGELVFELGNVPLGEFTAVGKFLLREPALQAQAFDLSAQFHKALPV